MNAGPEAARTPRGLTRYRLAVRLSRREVRRRPGRTLLVALLVALPVAGMFIADVMVRTNHQTPAQSWLSEFGTADAFSDTASGPTRTELVAKLPAGSRVVDGREYVDTRRLQAAGGHHAAVEIARVPLRDPITHGIVDLMSGRLPVRDSEVFLTRSVATALHVHAGETLHLTRPARHDYAVVGIGEYSDRWGSLSMLVTPTARLPWKVIADEASAPTLLIDLPADASPATLVPLAARLQEKGVDLELSPTFAPQQRDYGGDDTQRKVRWSWVVGALVLTVAGIVIASAFAIGARRQLVTLGQLAANGASPKVLRRILFLQGTWTGIIGALGGFGLAALALVALEPHIERIFQRSVHPYTISAIDVIPIFLLGVATATIAALLPARTTSRLPVLAALAGRRPLGRVPRWLPITGACVAAGGLALFGIAVLGASGNGSSHGQVWALTAIVGGVGVLLGACAIAPAYVSLLEPLAGRTRGSGRLAIRSLARQRTRTGAVVSAIAATAALAIAAASIVLSAHLDDLRNSRYIRADEVQLNSYDATGTRAPSAALVAAARKILPGATTFPLEAPVRKNVQWTIQNVLPDHPSANSVLDGPSYDPTTSVPVAIADRALVAAYGLRGQDQAQLARLGALFLGPSSGRAAIGLVTHVPPKAVAPPIHKFAAAMVDGHHYLTDTLPQLIVTPQLAQRFGMTAQPAAVVLHTPKNLTGSQRNRIADLYQRTLEAQAGTASDSYATVAFYQPPSGVDPLIIEWVLVGVALVMVLFVVAVNLALSATETRDERDVLTIVGAAPAAMRRANGYKAALLTVMGALLAIPVGFLPVVVFVHAAADRKPLVFPWAVVSLLVVGLPVVGGLVTTAASGVALRFRPVRVSTMAYD